MRIMVTGHSGFIGGRLIESLKNIQEIEYIGAISRNCREISCYCNPLYHSTRLDLTIKSEVKHALDTHKPNIIFHLAGNPMVKDWSSKAYEDNVLPLLYLLEECPKNTRIVFSSSATVYGNSGEFNKCLESQKLHPNNPYGAAKSACELLLESHQDKISYCILRLVANCGRGATHGVVQDLIKKLKSESEYLELLGDYPGSSKPYVYVGDTIKALTYFGFGKINDTINVSMPDIINIEEMANLIMDTIGIHKPIKFLGEFVNHKGDNRIVNVSNVKAINLGWKPEFKTSKEAIKKAVEELK